MAFDYTKQYLIIHALSIDDVIIDRYTTISAIRRKKPRKIFFIQTLRYLSVDDFKSVLMVKHTKKNRKKKDKKNRKFLNFTN